ncbi:crossover junction endodeoxyribonuclease RuvC [Gammaproteobacteria bacterium]
MRQSHQTQVSDSPKEPDRATILTLDLGTHTGWALSHDGHIHSGVEHFVPRRFEGGGMRFVHFIRWLNDVWPKDFLTGMVCFEEVRRHAGVDAAHVYGGFLGHLSAWCERQNIPYQGVPVGTIKKFAAGKGNASKAEMIAAVTARGFAPADDNEADALAILLWAIETGKI